MAMWYVERELRERGENDLADLVAEARKGIQERQGINDFPLPGDILIQAITEYKRGPLTPELVTAYWRAKLRADGVRAGLDITVPDCDWTEEEIQRRMVDIRGNTVPGMMVCNPEQLRGKEGLILLGKMYPGMASYTVGEDTPVTNTHETSEWIKVEDAIDAPNRNTYQGELEDFARRQGYFGQRESTYILASHASKDLTGRYFDEGETWSRLLGSRGERLRGRLRLLGVVARFDPDGRSHVDWALGPRVHDEDMGARFEKVKRA